MGPADSKKFPRLSIAKIVSCLAIINIVPQYSCETEVFPANPSITQEFRVDEKYFAHRSKSGAISFQVFQINY